MRRRLRTWHELSDDPTLAFRVGRLTGANEMAIALLQQQEGNEIAQRVAAVLDGASAWFLEPDPGSSGWGRRAELPPSELAP